MSHVYLLYTIEDDGNYPSERNLSHHAPLSWPRVLKDMADDFANYPMVQELWLSAGGWPEAGWTDEVLLWRRE